MKTFSFIYSIIIFSLIFSSCTENHPVSLEISGQYDTLKIPSSCPQPLKLGNFWIFEVNYYNEAGNIIQKKFDTARIVSADHCLLYLEKEKMMHQVFREYHSISPNDTVNIRCFPNILHPSDDSLFVLSTNVMLKDFSEDYQPYIKFNNQINFAASLKTCGNGWAQSTVFKENGDTAYVLAITPKTILTNITWGLFHQIESYETNYDIYYINGPCNNYSPGSKCAYEVKQYYCTSYYTKGIGLVRYLWYQVNKNNSQTLMIKAELIDYKVY